MYRFEIIELHLKYINFNYIFDLKVMNLEILKAPICDICIIARNDPIPEGFYRLSRTLSNQKANLNNGSGGKTMYKFNYAT